MKPTGWLKFDVGTLPRAIDREKIDDLITGFFTDTIN